jgi:hypothetical protein
VARKTRGRREIVICREKDEETENGCSPINDADLQATSNKQGHSTINQQQSSGRLGCELADCE